jgi:hypothetical protein
MHYGTTTLPHLPRNNTAGKINILYHSDFTPHFNPANDFISHTTIIKITFYSSLHFSVTKSTVKIKTRAVHSSTVGSGTVLHAKRLQVRFLMGSLGSFVDLILPAHYCLGGQLFKQKEVQVVSGGGVKGSQCLPRHFHVSVV